MQSERPRISDGVFLLLAVGLAVCVRLDLLWASNFVLDSDEAIVGLMAKHILEGRGVPVFYYGQHYMGSFEALMVSGVFTLLGMSSAAVKLVPFLFSLALVPLVYRLALEMTDRLGARVATVLIALPPAPLIVWSSMARGGFIELIVIGTGALLLTCRWLKAESPSLGATALIGFLLGFGWWVNFQIVFFLGPIGLMMLLHLVRRAPRLIPRHFGVGTGGFVLGSLPFWVYNFAHDFASFSMFQGAKPGRLSEHISGFFSTALPSILGAKRFWQVEDVFPFATAVVFCLYGALAVGLLVVRRREVRALFTLRCDAARPVELCALFVVTCGLVFCASSFGFLVQAPRYLLPMYVGLFVLVGVVVSVVARRQRNLALGIVVAILGINTASMYLGGRAVPGQPLVYDGDRVANDHTELLAWLTENGVPWVRTNYWIGYRLAFETGERTRFSLFREPTEARIDSYVTAAFGMDRELMPLVLVQSQVEPVKRALRLQGVRYKTTQRSGYTIIYRLKRREIDLSPVPPAEFAAVTATSRTGEVARAFDGDLRTRWGSGEPQRPGMEFSVRFAAPRALRGLRYDLGTFESDAPRVLDVIAELPDGTERHLVDRGDAAALRFYAEPVQLTFEPLTVVAVTFRQLGRDPVFDWSIAELEFFR